MQQLSYVKVIFIFIYILLLRHIRDLSPLRSKVTIAYFLRGDGVIFLLVVVLLDALVGLALAYREREKRLLLSACGKGI